MRNFYVAIFLLLSQSVSYAQVGISTTAPQAMLDVSSPDKGVLIPRIALTARNITAPVINPQGGALAEGTLVYNTATSGSSPFNVRPGFYFWDSMVWVALDGAGGRDWSLLGNSRTNPTTNFIGTTDNASFVMRTNNIQRAIVRSDGNVGINSNGNPNTKLRVVNTGIFMDAVHASNNDTVANSFWGTNTNAGGTAILGNSGTGPSVFPSTGAGVAGSGPRVGVYGTSGLGNPSNPAHYTNSGGGFSIDSDNNAATINSSAFAKIAGIDRISPNGTMANRRSLYGGYFNAGVTGQSYAYVGLKYNANAGGGGGTNFKVIGNGSNSTLINDSENKPRILFSPEAPEILFEDYGSGQLQNGVASIQIDEVLKDAIFVDEEHPLRVFIQLEGNCNGVFVTEKTGDGFKVIELSNGTSNTKFSWHIVANRADDKDANGNITSKHVGLRLPYGPLPSKEIKMAEKFEQKNDLVIRQ